MCLTPVVPGLVPLACTCGAGTGEADDFDRLVIGSSHPVAVVLWGPDCGPCRVLARTLECAVEVCGDRVTFAAIDISLTPQMAARLGVQGIPHLLFFAHGEPCCHFMGEIPWVYLHDKLERALRLQAQTSRNAHRPFTPASHNSA